MKVNSIADNSINNKRQTFSGLGSAVVEKMVATQDAVARAGLTASFICTDFLGSEAPRIVTGLFRNSDKTGQLNYKFASMEACRELLTAPVMMGLPIATFALANKYIGSAIKSPVGVIESFSNTMGNVYSNNKNIKDTAQLKQDFYKKVWETALKDTCSNNYAPDKKLIENLSSLSMELEGANKKDAIKNITDKITNLVTNEIRTNTDVDKSFTKIVYKDALGKSSTSAIDAFADHLKRFSIDSIKNIGDNVKSLSVEDFTKKLGEFKSKRIGGRIAMNFATVAAVILYVTQVPKLYKSLNKTNPGLIGLTDETSEKNTTNSTLPVDYNAFKKLKGNSQKSSENSQSDEQDKKVAFKGSFTTKLANSVKKDGKWRKFVNAFEFDGINMACAALVTALTLGVVTPRVLNSYDKHDRREILTRDIATLTAIVVGAKALSKTITRIFEKSKGLTLNEKPKNYFNMSKSKRILQHLRPFGGVQVFSNDDILAKYTNVDKYKGGFSGFCEYISKTGGNLSKLFANDETTKKNMEQMLGKTLATATDTEIINAAKNKNNAKYINKIVEVFKKSNNTFVKKAKAITGVFGFVSTFIAVPAFMIFLQKFNEKMTKRAIANERAEKKAIDQKFTAVKLTTDLITPDASKLNLK